MRDRRGLPKFTMDSDFWRSPRFAALRLQAIGLHVTGIGVSYREELDGRLPADVRKLAGVLGLQAGDVKPALRELVAAGVWLEVGNELVIGDYATDHPTRVEITARRAQKHARSL